MSLREILSTLPPKSKLRSIIRDLASADDKRREAAYTRADNFDRMDSMDSWTAARTPNWRVSEAEGHAILRVGAKISIPLPKIELKDGFHELVTSLWRSPHPSLAATVASAYANTQDARRRCGLLSLLAIIATRQAAEVFMLCIREHGWPTNGYSRLFDELPKLLTFADVMLPDVVLTAGPFARYVQDAVTRAIDSGLFRADTVGSRLEALAPQTFKSLKELLKSANGHQTKPGLAWRFTKRYHSIRHRVCALLDLAGHLKTDELSQPLHDAVKFKDPRIVTSAALSLLRRGEAVNDRILNVAAASHETRVTLYRGLQALGLQRRYPEKWKTWEAFAAADMVEWLLYPAELGREPDNLRLQHVEYIDKRPMTAVFVWKFRVKGPAWLAGISGPYKVSGKPNPVSGPYTFSRFDEWDAGSAKEHLDRCARNVNDVRGEEDC